MKKFGTRRNSELCQGGGARAAANSCCCSWRCRSAVLNASISMPTNTTITATTMTTTTVTTTANTTATLITTRTKICVGNCNCREIDSGSHSHRALSSRSQRTDLTRFSTALPGLEDEEPKARATLQNGGCPTGLPPQCSQPRQCRFPIWQPA